MCKCENHTLYKDSFVLSDHWELILYKINIIWQKGVNERSMKKINLYKNVYEALLERLHFIFQEFENIYISFSGEKIVVFYWYPVGF